MLRHALVLTAGLGTRLRPLTMVRAKPAIPIAGEAMARRIAVWLAAQGVIELVFNLHHLPETLAAELGDASDLGVRARYSWEQPIVLGSAGGPRHALGLIESDTFLIVNGDTLTDLDLAPLADAHAASGALVTMALVPNSRPDHYGGVRLAADGSIQRFVPRGAAASGSYHFFGVQIVHRSVFAALPDNEPRSSVGDVYDRLIAERPGSVRGWTCGAAYWDIGTPADYVATSRTFLDGRPDEAAYGRRSRIATDARLARTIVWDDVEIGSGAVLDDCIVTDGVVVPAGAVYRQAILVRADAGLRAEPL